MKKLLSGAVLALAILVGGATAARLAPKSIEDIMEDAHSGGKDSLLAKVKSGKGEAADVKQLLALYQDLAKNDPPRGTKESWKKKTDALIAAAKKVAEAPTDADALKALDKASNCAACHSEHKPKK